MSCEKIKEVNAREILDSRGNPTIEVEVVLDSGKCGIAAVPSGASTGKYEAHELRDSGDRYFGKGVLQAVKNVNEIINTVLNGMDICSQKELDNKLIKTDGSEFKSGLGANAILGTSLACAKAGAESNFEPLYKYMSRVDKFEIPVPMMNILNGGEHSKNNIDFQEFMIMPVGAKTFKEGLRWCVEVYHTLKKRLDEDNHFTGVGDEGGFAPNLNDACEALDYIVKAVKDAGFKIGEDFAFAIDVASSELYNSNNKNYYFKGESLVKGEDVVKSSEEMISYYESLISKYPIISIEDGLDQEDWDGWIEMTKRIGDKVMLVGDDLFVTNEKRLEMGITKKAGNAILIKPNQIGTLSETMSTIELAKKNNFKTIMSHRSGETEDSTIADLAVALGTPFIKTGAPCRSERVAKYNRLLKIECEISK